jgi:PqqD family protein of HPr-rel-A system
LNFAALDNDNSLAWQLRAGQQLRMLAGNDESVIYNDYSGETHLLSAIAVSILQHLKAIPANLPSISTFLASEWEFESDEELRRTAHALLAELDGLSLIETCRPR